MAKQTPTSTPGPAAREAAETKLGPADLSQEEVDHLVRGGTESPALAERSRVTDRVRVARESSGTGHKDGPSAVPPAG